MDILIIKVAFSCVIPTGPYTIDRKHIIKTITHIPNQLGHDNFDLQVEIDKIKKEIEKEGYQEVEILDVRNISTPIIKRR